MNSSYPFSAIVGQEEMKRALEKVRRDIASTVSDYTPSHDYNTAQVASREDFDQFERSLRRSRMMLPIAVVLMLAAAGAKGMPLVVEFGIAFDVMLETGILVDALPLWDDDFDRPQAFRKAALIQAIRRDGLRFRTVSRDADRSY